MQEVMETCTESTNIADLKIERYPVFMDWKTNCVKVALFPQVV